MSRKDDLLNAYEFEVHLGPLISLSFSKISGLERSGEIGVIGSGGENDSMHFYKKPRRRPDVTRFETGWSTGAMSSIQSFLFEGLVLNNIMIQIKRNGSTKKTLCIDRGILTKISYSDLDAMDGKILIKTLEIQHNGVKEK
ncbi:MAG: phage tail protein [Eubacterium sp.]|nr:phage tail protein [Eubacterium sp.]